MLTKSLSLASDNITYDLEDSVAPHEKANARLALVKHLAGFNRRSKPAGFAECAARVNAVGTLFADSDLETLGREPELDTIVIPKVNSASDLKHVADVLAKAAPERYGSSVAGKPFKLLALIESAAAILNLSEICTAGAKPSVNLAGLIFAAEDFSLDLSLTRTPSLKEFLYARSAIVTHARAFDLESTIDLVCTTYRGSEGQQRLQEECEDGKGMGFNGKQCIHPSQVDTVQQAFAPSKKDVEWSVRVVLANDKASKGDRAGEAGRGAWTLDGKMIDAPVVGKAKATVERARRCGFDINALEEKWKGQEPE
ncbi:putative citrate lyase beta subunit [Coniella lustricola]|uniref:Putative citrate lyase beta subunit n=1 Tax=Coniella lustricola TaxID=2025994 RepID=A0A2T3AH17_9PEZI|nr:putative citrate lyase beta subunit [Coniella lustricola]